MTPMHEFQILVESVHNVVNDGHFKKISTIFLPAIENHLYRPEIFPQFPSKCQLMRRQTLEIHMPQRDMEIFAIAK